MNTAKPRARSGVRLLLVTALCAVLAAACGTANGSGTSSGTAAKAAKVSLHITVSGSGTRAKQWTLRCDPPGGTHPDPAAACKVLMAAKSGSSTSLWGKPKMALCPMIAAGAQRATITGTWFGKHIHTVMYNSGCWLARWHKIGAIFN